MGATHQQQQENEEDQKLLVRCPASDPCPFSDEWIARMKDGHNELEEVLAWASNK